MLLSNFGWLQFYWLFLCFSINKVSASEKAVLNRIFEGYDPRVRPIKNTSLPVIVYIAPEIIRLIEVNAQQEYIKLLLSLDQNWKDEFLAWDPADYNGTKVVTVPTTAVWLPDTIIKTSSFESEQIVDKDRQMVKISSDGQVFLTYPFVLANYCEMKTDEFPYDEQNCIIKVTSWLFQSSEILFVPFSIDEATVPENKNSEWNTLPITSETRDFAFEIGQFRQIWYTMTIQRKPAYYVWVLIMPTFIITALSIAGIFAPVNNIGDRQEKVTLGLTTLLTLAVILSMVTGEMPRSANLPLLGQFVLVEIIIIVICMALSVVILFLHQRTTTRPWMMPLWFAGFCCRGKERKSKTNIVVPSLRPLSAHNTHARITRDDKSLLSDRESMKLLDDTLTKVSDCIDKIEQEMKGRGEEAKRKDQWLTFFDHVDLLLFIGFQIIHVVLYITLYHRTY